MLRSSSRNDETKTSNLGLLDVFARIARRYDFLCDLFSFGFHRLWKRRVAAIIANQPWTNLLDAAAGTGDVVLRVARLHGVQPHQRIVVSDISSQMLAVAKRRASRLGLSPEFMRLDAHRLATIPDSSIDVYAISLGLKICKRTQVLREAFRVLQPGGRFVTLETSNIPWPWVHRAYLFYMSFCVPAIGWLATGGDTSAYRYIWQSAREFPSAEAFAAELVDLGFADVSFERLSLGIVAIHVATKPHTDSD
jgi:demethylmenaquinone methyltransferase/2-methoxy-6-polyprenyl-1,4-benzoquinol methylase